MLLLKITPIKSLIGHDNEQFLLLGMLTQIEEGKMFLEDNDAHVELDLSQCVSLCTCYNSVVMVADESISPTEKHSWPIYRQLLHSGRRSVWRRPHFPR